MDYTHLWSPIGDLPNRVPRGRTMELNQAAALNLNTINIISSQHILEKQANNSSKWISDGLLSTVQGLETIGFVSNLYRTLYFDYVSSVVPLRLTADYISTSPISIVNSNYKRNNVFSDGTISTHTAVLYGSNTLILQGALSMYDKQRDRFNPLRLSNGTFITTNDETYYVSHFDLISSINGLQSGSYVSTPSLASTNAALYNNVAYTFLTSSLNGLGTMSYVSTKSYNSTVYNLIEYGGLLKKYQMGSTLDGLASASYISTTSLESTFRYLFDNRNVLSPELFISTVRNLQTQGFISSAAIGSTIYNILTTLVLNLSIQSTITSLGLGYASSCSTEFLLSNIVSINDTTVVIDNVGLNYLSTPSFTSTLDTLFIRFGLKTEVISSIEGLGTASYISSSDLFSTNDYMLIETISKKQLNSTIEGLGNVGYISSSGLTSTISNLIKQSGNNKQMVSTISGLRKAGYPTMIDIQSTICNIINPANSINTMQFTSLIDNLSPRLISTQTLTSTMNFFVSNYTFNVTAASTVDGLGFKYMSSSALASTIDFFFSDNFQNSNMISTIDGLQPFYPQMIDLTSTIDYIVDKQPNKLALRSTVAGLGTDFYISTASLISTSSNLLLQTTFPSRLLSTVKGLGSQYVSTSALRSTVQKFLFNSPAIINTRFFSSVRGIGSRYISTPQLVSTLQKVLGKYVLMDTIMSTVDGIGSIYMSTALASSLNTLLNTFINTNNITSAVDTVGNAGYVSSTGLQSTMDFILIDTISRTNLRSTVRDLTFANYISSKDLTSTITYLAVTEPIQSKRSLSSTIRGLVRGGYISSTHVASTVAFILNPENTVQLPNYLSTSAGLGTTSYVSTSQHISSFRFINTLIYTSNLTSTVHNLGSLTFISTTDIASTLDFTYNNYPFSDSTASTIVGLGGFGYVSTADLVTGNAFINNNFATRNTIRSTLRGLGNLYVSSSSLLSTTNALDLVSRYYPKWDAYYPPYVGIVGLLNVMSSLDGLVAGGYTNGPAIASTTTNYIANGYNLTQFTSTVTGLSNATTFSIQKVTDDLFNYKMPRWVFYSTIDGLSNRFRSQREFASTFNWINGDFIRKNNYRFFISEFINGIENQQTTDEEYVTDLNMLRGPNALRSTVNAFINLPYSGYIQIASTVTGIGSVDFMSSSKYIKNWDTFANSVATLVQITSTSKGLGSAKYISSPAMTSTSRGILTYSNVVLSSNIISTIDGLKVSNFIMSSNLVSTTSNIINGGYGISVRELRSNVYNIANNTTFISTQQFTSNNDEVFNSLIPNKFFSTFLSNITFDYVLPLSNDERLLISSFITSTFVGLGTFDYISTSFLTSTLDVVLAGTNTISRAVLTSSIRGIGSAGGIGENHYISTPEAVSTVAFYINPNRFSNYWIGQGAIISTINNMYVNINSNALGLIGYARPGYLAGISNISGLRGNMLNINTGIGPDDTTTLVTNTSFYTYSPAVVSYPSFIAVIMLYNNATSGSPIYTTNGQNWNGASFPTGITSFRTSGIIWTGRFFIAALGNYDVFAWSFMMYSSNGITWTKSTWSNSLLIYQKSSMNARNDVIVFGHDNNGNVARMSNSLLLYSEQNPNIWLPVNVTYTYQSFTSQLNLVLISFITTNGIFFVATTDLRATGFNGAYAHFTSFDGSNWNQFANPQGGGNNEQVSFNVGRYNYIGIKSSSTYSRSHDAVTWTNVTATNFTSPAILGAPIGGQNLSGIAINKGYFVLGNYIANPSRLFVYNFSCNVPSGIKYIVRSVSNSPSQYIIINDYTATATTFISYSSDNLTTSGASYNGGTNVLTSLVTNHDIPPPPPLELSNLSFIFYNGSMNYLNVRQPNVIGAQTLTNLSTVINLNDALFVMNNGGSNNVSFGSVQPRDYSNYAAVPYLLGLNSNNLGPPFSTLAFADVDGLLRITGDAIKPTNANWTGYSDKRIKENIYPANLKQCYGVLSTIKLKHFSYISSYAIKYNLGDKSQLGFIAQEVSTLFPKSTPNRFNVLSTGDTYYDLCKGQLDMSHYGATQYLISSMYSRSSLIGNQMIQLETFAGIYSTIQRF
jgi:hypothetical protein